MELGFELPAFLHFLVLGGINYVGNLHLHYNRVPPLWSKRLVYERGDDRAQIEDAARYLYRLLYTTPRNSRAYSDSIWNVGTIAIRLRKPAGVEVKRGLP